MARFSGDRAFSPCLSNQSILASVVRTSPKTASTPACQRLPCCPFPPTSLARVAASHSNNLVHVCQEPSLDAAEHALALGKRALRPTLLSVVCRLNLVRDTSSRTQCHGLEVEPGRGVIAGNVLGRKRARKEGRVALVSKQVGCGDGAARPLRRSLLSWSAKKACDSTHRRHRPIEPHNLAAQTPVAPFGPPLRGLVQDGNDENRNLPRLVGRVVDGRPDLSQRQGQDGIAPVKQGGESRRRTLPLHGGGGRRVRVGE